MSLGHSYDLQVEVVPLDGVGFFGGAVYPGRARVRARVTKDGKNVAGVRLFLDSQTEGVYWEVEGSLDKQQKLDVRTDTHGQYEGILSCLDKYKVAKIFVCAHARNLNHYSGVASHQSNTIIFGKKNFLLLDFGIVILFFIGWVWIFATNGPYMMATFAPLIFLIQFFFRGKKTRREILWEGVLVHDFIRFFLVTGFLIGFCIWIGEVSPLFLSIFLIFGMRKRLQWWDFSLFWIGTIWCLVENAFRYRDLLIVWSILSSDLFYTGAGLLGCFPVGFLGVQALGVLWLVVRPRGIYIPLFMTFFVGLQIFYWWLIKEKVCTKNQQPEIEKS